MGRAYSALGGPLITQCGDTSLFPQEPYLAVGSGWESGSYIVVGPSTNSHTKSEGFTMQFNPNSNTIDIGALTSPRGDATANRINSGTGGFGNFNFSSNPTNVQVTIGESCVISLYMNAGSLSTTDFSIYAGNGNFSGGRNCLLRNSGGAISVRSGDTQTTVYDCGGGWYRIIMPFVWTITSGAAFPNPVFSLSTNTGYISVWGIQIELLKAVASRYIPTNSGQVTETNTYSSYSGAVGLARAAVGVKSNGSDCSGSGVTWQVPPILF